MFFFPLFFLLAFTSPWPRRLGYLSIIFSVAALRVSASYLLDRCRDTHTVDIIDIISRVCPFPFRRHGPLHRNRRSIIFQCPPKLRPVPIFRYGECQAVSFQYLSSIFRVSGACCAIIRLPNVHFFNFDLITDDRMMSVLSSIFRVSFGYLSSIWRVLCDYPAAECPLFQSSTLIS